MALVPVKIHLPFELLPGETKAVTIEDQLPTISTVFDPLIRFHNPTGGVNMRLQVDYVLDMGFGDDPLSSGSFTWELVNETVGPDTLRDVALAQIDNDTTVVTRHVVTIENLDATETEIVRLILYGQTEVQSQLPASQQIIKAAT